MARVSFRYSHGRKLVGDRSAKSWLLPSCVTESEFADDAQVQGYGSWNWGLHLGANSDLGGEFSIFGQHHRSDGDLYEELSGWLAKAAKMFGCLRQSMFVNQSLSIETRRCVYLATVMATLLYGSGTWAVKADQMWRLEAFHNRCA